MNFFKKRLNESILPFLFSLKKLKDFDDYDLFVCISSASLYLLLGLFGVEKIHLTINNNNS